jgi:hypothetical protein
MKVTRAASFVAGMALMLSVTVVTGQEKGKKVEEPPAKEKVAEKAAFPKGRAKGYLPTYWGQLGLSDGQKQSVYQVQNKYKVEIDALEKQIEAAKAKMSDERLKVLTPEQQKRLEAIIRAKSGGGQ